MSALTKKGKSCETGSQSSVSETKKRKVDENFSNCKRMRYTFEEKLEILDELKMSTMNNICEKFGITERAVRKWKKERLTIEEAAAKSGKKDAKRQTKCNDLDDELYYWFMDAIKRGIPISGPVLQKQALILNKEIGINKDFKASNGWLDRWKKRKNVKNLKITGEKLSADEQAANKFKADFALMVTHGKFSRKQIFNMDETGLQFKLAPSRTFVPKDVTQISGPKKQLERVTVAACCNADGSFSLPLIVIGKSKNPHCFKNLNQEKELPVWYRHQKNAWMEQSIFEEWFNKQFVPLVEDFLQSQNLPLKALLLVDNCKAHKYLKLGELEIVFFPPNVTSLIQPMDQGILESLKIKYQSLLINATIQEVNDGDQFDLLKHLKTINLLKVVNWIAESWKSLECSSIYKCWKCIWPTETREIGTQTENSSLIIDDLSGSIGTEEYEDFSSKINSRVNDLLGLVKTIKGYEMVDSETLLNWLKKDNRDIPDEINSESGNINEQQNVQEFDSVPVQIHENNQENFSFLSESFDVLYQDL